MTRLTRRALLAGAGTTAAGLAAVPFVFKGIPRFLRQAVANHFGEETLALEGMDDFIADFAASASDGDALKRFAADAYFAFHGDRFHKISAAKEFENRFLYTLLTRSNIIAIQQGRSVEFDYLNPDPWDPQCGIYLSSAAETET